MPSTALPEPACPVSVDLVSSMIEALVGQVHRWSAECRAFLDWQRKHFFAAEPSNELRSRHESALRSLIFLGRILKAATSDPDFQDHRAAAVVKGRMAQLRHSWEIAHPTMSAEEAEAFLSRHFGPDSR